MFENLCEGHTFRVGRDGVLGEATPTFGGLKRGCVVSPLLFAVVFEYIARQTDFGKGVPLCAQKLFPSDSLVERVLRLDYLAFADDIVIFSETHDEPRAAHCQSSSSSGGWRKTRKINDVYSLVEPERPLGVGSFGTVFPGVHRETGEIFAVKHYPATAFSSPKEALQRVSYESEILRVVGEHRNMKRGDRESKTYMAIDDMHEQLRRYREQELRVEIPPALFKCGQSVLQWWAPWMKNAPRPFGITTRRTVPRGSVRKSRAMTSTV